MPRMFLSAYCPGRKRVTRKLYYGQYIHDTLMERIVNYEPPEDEGDNDDDDDDADQIAQIEVTKENWYEIAQDAKVWNALCKRRVLRDDRR